MKPKCYRCGDRIHFKGYNKFGDKIFFCKTCNEYRNPTGRSTPYEPRPTEENLKYIYLHNGK